MNVQTFDTLYSLYNANDNTKKYKVIYIKEIAEIDFERKYTIRNLLDFYSLYLYYKHVHKNIDFVFDTIDFIIVPLVESEYKNISLDDLITVQQHIKYNFSSDDEINIIIESSTNVLKNKYKETTISLIKKQEENMQTIISSVIELLIDGVILTDDKSDEFLIKNAKTLEQLTEIAKRIKLTRYKSFRNVEKLRQKLLKHLNTNK